MANTKNCDSCGERIYHSDYIQWLKFGKWEMEILIYYGKYAGGGNKPADLCTLCKEKILKSLLSKQALKGVEND